MSLLPSYMSSQNVAAWRRSGFGSATLGLDSGDLALARTRVLLVGGADDEDRLHSDVWETDSLGNFKLLKSDAAWSPRTNMATTVHTVDGVEWLYVMAGFEWRMQDGLKTGAYLNDVWRMPGTNLFGDFEPVKTLSNTGIFTGRARSLSVSYRSNLYLIGGCSGRGSNCDEMKEEILTSKDGILWTPVTVSGHDGVVDRPMNTWLFSTTLFQGVAGIMGTVHQDNIYLFGGRQATKIVRLFAHPSGVLACVKSACRVCPNLLQLCG